jgi:ribosomal RNA-processing protein 12
LVSVCDLLVKLFPLRQPLLTRHATEVLGSVCASSVSRITAEALDKLLGMLLQQEAAWDRRDVGGMLAIVQLLETGLAR